MIHPNLENLKGSNFSWMKGRTESHLYAFSSIRVVLELQKKFW